MVSWILTKIEKSVKQRQVVPFLRSSHILKSKGSGTCMLSISYALYFLPHIQTSTAAQCMCTPTPSVYWCRLFLLTRSSWPRTPSWTTLCSHALMRLLESLWLELLVGNSHKVYILNHERSVASISSIMWNGCVAKWNIIAILVSQFIDYKITTALLYSWPLLNEVYVKVY